MSSPVFSHRQPGYNQISDRWIETRFVSSLAKQRNGKGTPRTPPFALTMETRLCLAEVIDAPGLVPLYASFYRQEDSYLLTVRCSGGEVWEPLIERLYIGIYDVILARRIVSALQNRMEHEFCIIHYEFYDTVIYDDDSVYDYQDQGHVFV